MIAAEALHNILLFKGTEAQRRRIFFIKSGISFVYFVFFVCFVLLSFSQLHAQKIYQVKDQRLDEISGIASSMINEGIYYVLNDSGGKNEVYAINNIGETFSTIVLSGLTDRDWEDIAIGPGPDSTKSYIYVGEIGDNKAQYRNVSLYRFEEPVLKVKGFKENEKVTIPAEAIDKFAFIYEDGAKDCETLFIDPLYSDVYLVSKREEKVGLYQIKSPLSMDSLNVARRLISLDFPLAVAGDISKSRDKILIKTYSDVYYWDVLPNQPIEEALKSEPIKLPNIVEPQGESICWSADGTRYLTISETSKDKPLYLYIYPFPEDTFK